MIIIQKLFKMPYGLLFCVLLLFPCCCQTASLSQVNVEYVTPKQMEIRCSMGNTTVPMVITLLHNNITVAHADLYPNGTLLHDHEGEIFQIIGSQTSLLFTKLSTLDDTGIYICQVQQNSVTVSNEMYNVSVKGRPTILLNQTSPVKVFVGDDLSIACITKGNPDPFVSWSRSTSMNQVTGDATLSIKGIATDGAGVYKCSAKNIYGNTSAQLRINVIDNKPGVPANVSVVSIRQDRLTLQWDAGFQGKSKILSYRLTVNNAVPTTIQADKTSHVVKFLQSNTNFRLQLQACNQYGCGLAAIRDVTTLEEGVPSPPTNLRILNSLSHSITLAWDHGGNRSKPVAYTEISYHALDFPISYSELVDGTETSFTVHGLEAFKDYMFSAKTCISYNASSQLCSLSSLSLDAKTNIAAPTEPLRIQVFNTIESEVAVRVTWQPPINTNGPPDISYRVYYRTNISNVWLGEEVPSMDNFVEQERRIKRANLMIHSHVLNSLNPLTLYWIKVAAYSAGGLTNSTMVSIGTDEAAPNRPLNLTLVRKTANSLTIYWKAPLLDSRANNIYNIYAKDIVNGKSYAFVSEEASETTIERLLSNTAYNVSVFITLERQRDKMKLTGPAAIAVYRTGLTIVVPPPDDTDDTELGLIAAMIVSLLAVLIAMIFAVWYCRKKNLLGVTYKSTFYVEEATVPLSLRRSIRQSAKRHSVPAEKFADHVAKLHRDSDYLFSEEYGSLSVAKADLTWVHSTSNLNQPKNRYPDIVAYDHSRVRLMSIDGVPSSNYINANFVDGFKRTNHYIATQAPLSRTVDDFWRMIWEQDSRIVIMVTNLWERGRKKCDQYWPNEGQQSYVDVSVEKLSEDSYASYVLRTFLVTKNKREDQTEDEEDEKPRTIYQYHYTDWPDYGVPQDKSTVLSFIAKTREHEADYKGPSLVHCSAGVGRSGTFIALDAQMRRVDKEHTVDIYNFVRHMRSQRNFMVQQEGQFVFIYDALLEYILFGNTEMDVIGLEKNIEDRFSEIIPNTGKNRIEMEWTNISNMKIPEHTMNIGKRPCNFRKNRDPCIIPVDASRARLTMRAAAEGTDYINASYVDSYLEKRTLIVTQAPLPDTIEDFWRLIWENATMVVVSLLSYEELQEADFCNYLPRKDCNPINFGVFEIECLCETNHHDFTMRQIRLKHRIDCGESEQRNMWHFHYHEWLEDKVPCSFSVFEMIKRVKQKQAETDMKRTKYESHPLVFHCSCGVGRTGVFCALYHLWEQLNDNGGSVDIATTVKILRNQRPFMIQSQDDYDYLYRTVVDMQAFIKEEDEETSKC